MDRATRARHARALRIGIASRQSGPIPASGAVTTFIPRSAPRSRKARTPLQSWFYAIHLFTTTRHGVSAKELQRQIGVTYKTAWRMAALIRQRMADVDGERPIGGPGTNVEIDETLVGGVKKGKHNRVSHAKTVVVAALQRGGDLITAVVPNQRRATPEPFVQANVEKGGISHTDELGSYANLAATGYRHARVNHSAEAYAYCDYRLAETVSVNGIENFWRHLKCSIQGTHTSVSPKYQRGSRARVSTFRDSDSRMRRGYTPILGRYATEPYKEV